MGRGIIDAVAKDSQRVVLHQPKAHRAWQAPYRTWQFRRAVSRLCEQMWALTVDHLNDDDLALLDELVSAVDKVIQVHISRLGDTTSDHLDRDYFIGVLRRLAVIREGLAEGVAPDPAKRPTRAQLLDELAEGLRHSRTA